MASEDDIKIIGASNKTIELVLELFEGFEEKPKCGYYLVDNHARSVFWLEDFDANQIVNHVRGVNQASMPHISKHSIHHWQHVLTKRGLKNTRFNRNIGKLICSAPPSHLMKYV